MIDPPSGWKYGFPKAMPKDVTDPIKWLIENGYPAARIVELGDLFYCRHWYQETEDV